MKISFICAMDNTRGIGKNDRIPWHIKKDLVRLKDMTKGGYVILGRTSYDSMAGYYDKSGRPMPAKEYVVITHNPNFKSARENTFAATSIDDAVNHLNEKKAEEAFVIGGATIYEQMLKYADRLYLTIVDGNFSCDTFFPDYSEFTKVIHTEVDEDEGHRFKYVILEK